MREAYRKCKLLPSTKRDGRWWEKIKNTFKEQFPLISDFRKEEIEKMNIDDMNNENLQELVRRRGSWERWPTMGTSRRCFQLLRLRDTSQMGANSSQPSRTSGPY